MSYAVDVPPEALQEIRAFDLDVQELALDGIDLLADAADGLPRHPLPIEHEHR